MEANKVRAYSQGTILTKALNTAISNAVASARGQGFSNVTYIPIETLEVGHEMCTGSPALFAGEQMSYASLTGPAFGRIIACGASGGNSVVCALAATSLGSSAKRSIEEHIWRAAHPNKFGQADIARAVVVALSG
jgi:hypothetical protein